MTNYSEASYAKQVFVGLIDASLCLTLTVTLSITKQPEVLYQLMGNGNSSHFVFILFAVYRFVALCFFNQTIGMRLLHVILLNGDDQPLTFLEKSLAAVFILFRGTAYYTTK
ncbi:hypothetical protein [Flavisolibacter tropicus]|uniref:RDD domain-containing protein n=1 Tax=Flavisolibacter tropicus TaxID=1492898 RepID=A0A172TZY4_9BACT|nr:hypothetical protein [Flavisolibacter tropicus]ANE52297.1 hypothetical protein SY85_19215 [Flavisolibacter tropicus]